MKKLSLLLLITARMSAQWIVNDPVNTAVNTAIQAGQEANHVEILRQWASSLERLNQQLQELQAQLTDTEDKIQASRRFYNGGVRDFNTKIQVFPNNVFAKRLGFTKRDFFEVEDPTAIAEPPRVQF